MAKTNVRAADHRVDPEVRVAGGFGAPAAVQDPERLLRRVVLANLLWEDLAYEGGASTADAIRSLVPQVPAETVAMIAVEARERQKLRHVPLLLARECARHDSHRHVVAGLLPRIVRRADELTEFLALYWQDGRQPLSAGVKRGLAEAFTRFDAYQLAKYDRGAEVKLRDVMFLVHPAPRDDAQAATFRALADGTLPAPDTWEVALSRGEDPRETWTRLIQEGRLPALAFLRNLRNIEEAGVPASVVREAFTGLRADRLLPLNFFAAAQAAPRWQSYLEDAMFRSLAEQPRLLGLTHLIVDVSGSMIWHLSSRSAFNRLEAAAAMAVAAREVCEDVVIWVTAGSDYTRQHQTEMLAPDRGFALAAGIARAAGRLGGGGIFTRQCVEYIRAQNVEPGERTIAFTDSQDCERPGRPVVPQLFSPRNYIADVSAHARGISYEGVWTAEIGGWSEHFLTWIAALEAVPTQ